MTITLARPTTDEILLDAAAPARAAMHTSKIAVRNLRRGSLFVAYGRVYRAVGCPVQLTVGDKTHVIVTVVYGPDNIETYWLAGINDSVSGVVGAI
jgi:hypothetical protein